MAKHTFFPVFIAFFAVFTAFAQSPTSALVPMVNHCEVSAKGTPFCLDAKRTKVFYADSSLLFSAQDLSQSIQETMGITLDVTDQEGKSNIRLSIDTTLVSKERYRIDVSKKDIQIVGATPAAVWWAVQTFHQILLGDVKHTSLHQVAALQIDDSPRFAYRALMLDPARHFLPVADIKKFIDEMANFKYNVLQLHLTDDQGWRMEIKKHPKLASKQHYTQEELRDLIKYARERHIMVVPEVDVPGHTVAILSAYPELACQHLVDAEKVVGRTEQMMLCAAQPKVYDVLADVIEEISKTFDAPYIHLGGDESAIEKNWAHCDRCKQMMKDHGYTDISQLMIPFFSKVLGYVKKAGKKPILWCELNNIWPPADKYLFPYPQDVTLVTWRNALTPTCLSLTAQSGNPIIMAPGEHAYLDYPQYKNDLPEFKNWGMPITTLQKTYELDPAYGGTAEDSKHILGVMGTLWGEAIPDINRASYMAFPRALALAEAGWTEMEYRSWDSFKQRIYPNLNRMMKSGVSFRVPYEIEKR